MKKSTSICIILLLFTVMISCHRQQRNEIETVIISGKVTDFDGLPVDSSIVEIKNPDFTTAYETYTDQSGNYSLKVEKGKYMAMYAMRPKEYPRANAVPKEDMKLEFWAWNIVADKDLTINPRYHKLEIYGTNVFKVRGGPRTLFVYFRPMSVTKLVSYSEDILLNKSRAQKISDISVQPENLEVKIYADDHLLKINSIQPIEEYPGEGNIPMLGYIAQVEAPETTTDSRYMILRIVAENKELGEKGENLYFYELDHYRSEPAMGK